MITFHQFMAGIRPKTLAAAFVPPVVAYSLFYSVNKTHYPLMLFFCLGLALSIQIATNFYNDAIDFIKGADEKRVGPARITTQGKADYKKVLWTGHFFIFITVLFAVPIVMQGGLLFILLGLISIFFAYGYTGGPFPLAYLGLGELFVFIFFGLLATVGSFYLYALKLDTLIWIQASIIGFLSMMLIAINNFRDKETDLEVGKRTLATRMDSDKYKLILDIILFTPYFLALYLFVFVKLEYVFVLLAAGVAHKIHQVIHHYENVAELNQALALAGKHLVVFGLLLSLANIWN